MPLSTCDPYVTTPELIATLTTPDRDTPILNAWVAALGAARVAALLSDDPDDGPDVIPGDTRTPSEDTPATDPEPAEDTPNPAPDVADDTSEPAQDTPDREVSDGPDAPAEDTGRPAEEPAPAID